MYICLIYVYIHIYISTYPYLYPYLYMHMPHICMFQEFKTTFNDSATNVAGLVGPGS